MTSIPSFRAFFEAVHPGRTPFPWQVRLAERVLAEGWPSLLDLPTGVGKTSALDAAIYTLAVAPQAVPRRTLLVVDRRIVVDQGAVHARAIQRRLMAATTGPLKEIADALRAIWSGTREEAPFAIAVMRGGMPRDNDWAKRPDQPVLGVSTVDQVGSRLLFRGYGVGPKSASIHAGLIGNDTLILLDEVHLARPFAQTLAAVRDRFHKVVPGLPSRFVIVEMSATPGKRLTSDKTFGLADEDHADPTLRVRLTASKSATLIQVKVTGDDEAKKRAVLAEQAIGEALKLQSGGAKVVGLVVNRVDTARLAYKLLTGHQKATDTILLTGRMRPIDRDHLVQGRLLPRAGSGRTRSAADRPLVVIATQCIEAGADLDFDALVTECASLDALRQRFGRVDRRGELGQSASVILARSDTVAAKANDPIYGGAIAATWQWLSALNKEGPIDFGSTTLPPAHTTQGEPDKELLAPALNAPILLASHLDAWAQTSAHPTPDPDVALWLHGPSKATADVQIVWRADLDLNADSARNLADRLGGCRPSALEAITIPLVAARQWLGHLSKDVTPAIADVIAGEAEGSETTTETWRRHGRRSQSADVNVALRWQGDQSELIGANDLRPGDVLVIPASRGGLTSGSFDPSNEEPITDLGDLAQLRGRGVATLRLHPGALVVWGLPSALVSTMPAPTSEESPAELRDRVSDWLRAFPVEPPEGFRGTAKEWKAARDAWCSRRRQIHHVDGQIIVKTAVSRASLGHEIELSEALTEDDDSSFRQAEVTLHTHSNDVREVATRFGRGVGLGDDIAHDLALAGWLHDIGKADPRFQRWLVGGSEVRSAMLTEPLAKSALPPGSAIERAAARKRAGYPAGCRHELLSLEMIRSSELLSRAKDPDLVMHLVSSHHGWCRPFAPPIDDPESIEVALSHDGANLSGNTQHHLARLDSGVSDRFWDLTERYGWWGLAWLESILRLADHRASEAETETAK